MKPAEVIMKTIVYETLPPEALAIRMQVFVREQGFTDEEDEHDGSSIHLVLFDGETPVATCRTYPLDEETYLIGRVAVVKSRRGEHVGALVLGEAENEIRRRGGKAVVIHAQMQARDFYLKQGYAERGVFDLDQGCPHTWLDKRL